MGNKKSNKQKTLNFTGERLIPNLNKGATFYYEHLLRYFFASQYSKKQTVLDAGCGAGYGSYILATLGKASQVIGVDISKDAINYASQLYKQKNISFLTSDIRQLTEISNNSIDLAVSFEVIEHIKEQNEFLREIKRILSKNGIMIVSTPNTLTYPKGNKYHEKELDPNSFKKLLKTKFKNVYLYSQKFFLSAELSLFKHKNNTGSLRFNSENFGITTVTNFKNSIGLSNAEYLVAVCSDSEITVKSDVTMSLNNVDNYDLSSGMISLSQQMRNMYIENQVLKDSLRKIQDSKFYKLWPLYSKIKRLFKL